MELDFTVWVCVWVFSGIFWGWELLRKTICKWQQITILNYFCFKTLHSLLGLTWLKLAEAGVQPALLSSLYTQCVQKAKPEVMNVAQHWYYFCEFTKTKRFYDRKNMLKKIGRCTLTYHQVRVLKKLPKNDHLCLLQLKHGGEWLKPPKVILKVRKKHQINKKHHNLPTCIYNQLWKTVESVKLPKG